MSGSDKLIIGGALAVAVAALAVASLLMPALNTERADLELVANEQVMANLPPDIALTQAMLGSFRGLAVDLLWARATKMKQDGKFYEAMQLSEWITKLQPRFPQVWDFHAWNMAYNISVATHTPAERWMWVKAGVDLLRDKAIPLNPNSVMLYKSLGNIFLHKIGQYSDEMHWYYKLQLAKHWHEILGPPPNETTAEVIDAFRPIADAYEKYINRNRPSRDIHNQLEELIENTDLANDLSPLRPLPLARFEVRLRRLHKKLQRSEPQLAAKISPLLNKVHQQQAEAKIDPLDRLVADRPDLTEQIRRLGDMGLRLNESLLRRIAKLRKRAESMDVKVDLGGVDESNISDVDRKLQAWLNDSAIASQRKALIAFARALVLDKQYHMDSMWMLELMEGRWFVDIGEQPAPIPIDWRHPGAHGLYWSAMGVQRSQGVLRPEDYDALNTDRQMLHSLQQLTRSGHIVYDPYSGRYNQLPDPRFIIAYDKAVFGASERIFSERLKHSAAPETFQEGHRNFLTWATQMFYFYGDQDNAAEFYRRLREQYSKSKPEFARMYSKPLKDFVLSGWIKEQSYTSLNETRAAVMGLINRYLDIGLANGQMQAADRYLDLAKRIHTIYQQKQNRSTIHTPNISRNRMTLPPFSHMVAVMLGQYMLEPIPGRTGLLTKASVWQNAPDSIKRMIFDRIRKPLYTMARRAKINPQIAFPPPVGMDQYRKNVGLEKQVQENFDLKSGFRQK